MALPQSIKLTDKQAAFVKHAARGQSLSVSATLAGYSEPEAEISRLKRLPHVMAALDIELRGRLRAEVAPLAFAFLVEVVKNEKSNYGERVRVDAAKILLDRAGYTAPKAGDSAGKAVKDPHEMSVEELHDLVSKLEDELAGRAKPIQPDLHATDPQLAEMLE